MQKAQCYYEILGVQDTAGSDEIKKAYRNLALVWHPDKNQANPEAAHAKFQTILKAYETLSDPKEREWYDRHKDLILSDGDENNRQDGVNLFQYFSSACYVDFDDSPDGFYTVYRNLFEEIAKEEEDAMKIAAKYSKGTKNKNRQDEDKTFPTFGDSKSSYEDIVGPFYAYWSGFCTSLTFDHLDKYNTTEAENRRILRAMEKENKKVKDAAKKERNMNVRNLVEFIRKRDKRIKAHKLMVERQNELNRQKTAEKQRLQREKRLLESTKYQTQQQKAAWEDVDDLEEQLRQLESEYDDLEKDRRGRNRRTADIEYSDGTSDDDDESDNGCDKLDEDESNQDSGDKSLKEEQDNDNVEATQDVLEEEEDAEEEESFFCPACNKDFKSMNAFENHEASKKHKQNVLKLAKLLKADESKLNK